MTSGLERCDSPDLFDDFNVETEETHSDDRNRDGESDFTNVRLRENARFSCSGKVEDTRQLLREFTTLIRNEVKDTDWKSCGSTSPPSVTPSRVSSNVFVYPLVLDQLSLKQDENLETFFNMLRMSLYELESITGTVEHRTLFARDGRSTEAEDLRRQISALLIYMTESISALCQDITTSSKETLKNIMVEIKGTLLQIGRIHQLPFFGFSLVKDGHPYYHACLDVWYAALKNLALIQRAWRENSPCVRFADYLDSEIDDITRYSTFDQMIDILLSDLISLAALRFNDELLLSDDCWCFTCPCVLKLLSLTRSFWNATSQDNSGETFWSRLHKSIRRFFTESHDESRGSYSDRFVVPFDLRKSIDASAFFWRLLRGLICVYQDTDSGTSSAIVSNDLRALVEFLASKTIVPLLGNTFNRSTTTEFNHTMQMETKLRFLLLQYLIVFTAYNVRSSATLPLELWQYYQKRLGFTFCSQEISELLVVYESASEWLEKLRRLARPVRDVGSDRRNSFELFLAIVVTHCQDADAGARLWTQMKGRILTRLTARRFQEFSECALFNCLRLLLSVANFFEVEIMTDYVLDFFSEIPLQGARGGVSKQKIVWQAVSVTILIHQERDSPIEAVRKICQYLASSVLSVQQAYNRKKNDAVVRRDLWELLSYFFKLLHELSQCIKGKNSLLPVLPLWTMEFYQIFVEAKECGDVRGQHRLDYLSAVAEILKQLSQISENDWQRIEHDERQKWLSVVKDRLLRSVRLHLHQWPWSQELAEVWYYFVAVSAVRSDFRISAVILFNEFVNVATPNFDADILCRFLSKLIENPDILPRISQEGETSQEETTSPIVKAWLRCLFVTPQSAPSISEITKFVSDASPWRDLLEEYYRNGSSDEVSKIGGSYGHCQLFKDICLALELRSCTQPADKPKLANLCQKMFTNAVRKLTKILTNTEPLDIYTHCTRLLAFLVEHCAPLIHHRDANESLLREIVALTVCNVGTDTTPALVKRRRVDMAAECLLHILRGLLKCDWNQNEGLKKQILECYRIELMRLAHERKNGIMDASPLVVVLKETFSLDAATTPASTQMENFRLLLLVDIRVFATNRCANDKPLARTSLAFVRSLIERTRSVSLLDRESDEILWICLSVWLLHEDRALVTDCAEVIDICRTKLEERRSLATLLTDGFTRVSMERWQQFGWSKILGLAAQLIKRYPLVKNEMAACVEKVTEDVKAMTGSGTDMRMTAALHYFTAEISIL